MTTRRDFLKCCAAAVPTLAWSRALATGHADGVPRCLVVVRLGGGNDGLNTVAPVEDDVYRRLRPSLALSTTETHSLGRHGLALRSATARPGRKQFDAGRLAVVTNVGYPRPDRSHFQLDGHLAYGVARSRARTHRHPRRDARRVEARGLPRGNPGLALLDTEMPLGLVHPDVQVPLLATLDQIRFDEPALVPLLELDRSASRVSVGNGRRRRARGDPLGAAVGARRRRRDREPVPRERARPPPGDAVGAAAGLRGLDLRIAYVAHDGFDTPDTRQKDNHAALLGELGDALAAFQNALIEDGLDRDVVTLTFSEFGRRIKNGSKGTDHGAAAPLFVLGSAIRGGVFGDAPDLTDLEDGDVRFTTDFRQVYATLLERWFNVDARPILASTFEPIPFLPATV